MEGRALGEMFDKKELSVVAMIYNSTLIGLSLFITFLGYRFFKVSTAMTGAILGGFLGWYTAQAITASSSATTQEVARDIGALVLGVIAALLTFCFRHAMLFVFGAAFGVQIGSMANVMVLRNQSLPSANQIGYTVIVASALVCGLFSSCGSKTCHIILTAFVGAYWTMQAIGHFAGGFPPTFQPFQGSDGTIPVAYFGYLAGVIVLGIVGVGVQMIFTAGQKAQHSPHKRESDTEGEESGHHYFRL